MLACNDTRLTGFYWIFIWACIISNKRKKKISLKGGFVFLMPNPNPQPHLLLYSLTPRTQNPNHTQSHKESEGVTTGDN